MRPVALTVGALLATAALLSACSDGPPPLGDSHVGNVACFGIQEPPGKIVAFGGTILQNTSSSTVTVQNVTLGSPHGEKMTGGAWLIPILKDSETGTGDWPPTAPGPGRARAWALRHRAAGAVIKPGQSAELIVGVSRTGFGEGKSTGPVIVYSAGGSTFTVQKYPSIWLGDHPCHGWKAG